MERKTIVLTPELAQAFLDDTDDRQRKISMPDANKIARDIKNGRWTYLPFDAICLSEEGKLIDGQHRCLGVVIANKSVKTDVLYNVPSNLFEKLDQNKPRRVKDFVFCKNYNTVAGMGKFAFCIENGAPINDAMSGRIGRRKVVNGKKYGINGKEYSEAPSNQEVLDYIKTNENALSRIAELGVKTYNDLRISGKTLFADAFWLALYLDESIDIELIDMFCDELCMSNPTSDCLAWLKASFIRDAYRAKIKHQTIDRTHALYTVLAMIDGYVNNTGTKSSVPRYVKTIEKKYNTLLDARRENQNGTN